MGGVLDFAAFDCWYMDCCCEISRTARLVRRHNSWTTFLTSFRVMIDGVVEDGLGFFVGFVVVLDTGVFVLSFFFSFISHISSISRCDD